MNICPFARKHGFQTVLKFIMLIFIKDRPIDFVNHFSESHFSTYQFDLQLNPGDPEYSTAKLKGKVLLGHLGENRLIELLDFLTDPTSENPELLVIECDDKTKIKALIKNYFEVVKASGGIIVNKDGNLLMIKRLGKWDLPKGKREKGETASECGLREVEEECNIKVKVGPKIVTSWHTYSMKNHKMLKQTKWYAMKCQSDKNMKPQKEEGIEAIKWMNAAEIKVALNESYASISYVIQKGFSFQAYQAETAGTD